LGARAVTIGIGFECRDGIVLCADTQLTWPQYHKYYERKIYPHLSDSMDYTIAFTFAGNPDLMKSFNGKFADALKLLKAPFTADKIQALVETVLDLMDVVDGDESGLFMLCGIVIPDKEMRLIKTSRKIVSRVDEYVGYDYVGAGDSSVLRFLGELLAHQPGDQFIERHATVLGSYLVSRAIAYVDGCGGDTDIFVLHSYGTLEDRGAMAYRYEQSMLRIEHFVKAAAMKFFDRRVQEIEFTESIERLNKSLQQEHLQFQVPPRTKYEGWPTDNN
jgi:hypothetical protein